MLIDRFKAKPQWFQVATVIFLITLFSSCAKIVKDYAELYGPSSPKDRILTSAELKQNKHISFKNEVQPILSNRCAVCHSCNDAPCQINFTSMEGIDRGASVEPVYNGARFSQQDPSRLGIDAFSTAEWRAKGFFPILNERRENPQINRYNSLLYKAITLKRLHDYPTQGRLPEEYDIGTKLTEDESFVHAQVCPTVEDYSEFAVVNSQWGMPFALPPVSNKEFKTIETWLEQGAKTEPVKPLSKSLQREVDKWERFFNGASNKERLAARYIYEHIYLGHLYFKGVSDKEFFTLVRSTTPPGTDIKQINTIRPYNDPGTDKFFYRLQRYNRVIVDKTHMPYALDKKRMKRYKELFIDADYSVSSLPSYDPILASNPFKAFAEIPAKNRYKFMLDEAKYFVNGFIKGPVCRGSIALSVIDDHFWVAFMDPDKSYISQDSEFLARVSDKLRMPSEQENSASLLSVWATYSDDASEYFLEKIKYLNEKLPEGENFDLTHIWDGDKTNDNAALTVYRHYDSATVLKGFIGGVPKTGWVMDYPVLERIHYLLVAGFDVYGKVGHQLSTRLYMDFLRFESEIEFLAFLPIKDRAKVHRQWYRGTDITEDMLEWFDDLDFPMHESKIKYETDDTKKEFFARLSYHLAKAQRNHGDYLNQCKDFPIACKTGGWHKKVSKLDKALYELSRISGKRTSVFPNVTFLRIKVDGSVKNDKVYTIVRNKSYLNVNSLMVSEDIRVPEEDTIDVISGFVGAYPNFFLQINMNQVSDFVDEYKNINSFEAYEALVDRYGVRRTSPDFWDVSDWFYKKHQYDNKVYAGLFDLNRYKNR